MKLYFWNILQAFDRLINAVFGGTDKEYMSSRVYRYRDVNGVALWVYTFLNMIEDKHCEKAFMDCQIGMDVNDEVWK